MTYVKFSSYWVTIPDIEKNLCKEHLTNGAGLQVCTTSECSGSFPQKSTRTDFIVAVISGLRYRSQLSREIFLSSPHLKLYCKFFSSFHFHLNEIKFGPLTCTSSVVGKSNPILTSRSLFLRWLGRIMMFTWVTTLTVVISTCGNESNLRSKNSGNFPFKN